LRKVLRKLNKVAKSLTRKFKKELKYESITRVLDASYGLFRLFSPLKEECARLTRRIIAVARRREEALEPREAEELIVEINRFNMCTRSYKSIKRIKNESAGWKKKRNYLKQRSAGARAAGPGAQVEEAEDEPSSELHSLNTWEENEDYMCVLLNKTSAITAAPEHQLRDYQTE
jgi:hypothetical protein